MISTIAASEFCDTNVLAYASDVHSPKRDTARELVRRLTNDRRGVASIQVLQELFVTLTRKHATPLPQNDARAIIAQLALAWHIFEPTTADVLRAIDNASAWQVSFWDAMLLTAANQVGTSLLWSEDLNDGQTYGAATVRNPFRS